MRIHLIPKQPSPNLEMRRQKLEKEAQKWWEFLLNGGDYKSCGVVLSTIGTDWLRDSGHDVLFLP
jgi:hypothetical protein